MNPDEAADKVIELSMRGPFSATEAAEEGLVTATIYPFELRQKIGKEAHFKGFPHYATIYTESDLAIDSACTHTLVRRGYP